MSKEKAIKTIKDVLNVSKVGVLSTSYNNLPNSRYMMFYNDEEVLYTKTSKDSFKVDEIESNPHVHILLGYEETKNHRFVEYTGKAEIVEDQETIDWLWEKQDKSFFKSKDDPELIVLKMTPSEIRLLNDDELDTPKTVYFK
ncbi:pyridoxamine 5'-phosphate oxidase family protein [Gracilibacillus caseinilyticus]|uniref:Pyridoxamine 5'-phosphate oxidase family protein n=1 Tax=Gracilibacillus caseinilyticus TaxID=2932256 RepID=A0ABY4EZ67_9BACI|nr:pyridoxamine 5'-phosphate oxidase family protein [Gracilibacillus caseinilyticus]UOQ49689.1 pyridoxamine 5'-phosphate oxidase family protein [Gracilibacillus caseinilyticus]